ncbi:hypothetical protein BKA59DRAFT_251610 [Fusarium tricinctum]|uniref:Uncharacterized protein n=1 Tax=Fusarium tricinctum TaxID=61284 RepID=A0A8K0W7Y2_9HYPO|nr:hypothetical protein BKA59DRAFT_251610 [Fusarium tricinctum]
MKLFGTATTVPIACFFWHSRLYDSLGTALHYLCFCFCFCCATLNYYYCFSLVFLIISAEKSLRSCLVVYNLIIPFPVSFFPITLRLPTYFCHTCVAHVTHLSTRIIPSYQFSPSTASLAWNSEVIIAPISRRLAPPNGFHI